MSWLLAIRSAASWICIHGFALLCHRCIMTSAVAFTELYLQMLKGPVGVSRGGLKTAANSNSGTHEALINVRSGLARHGRVVFNLG